MKLDDKGLKALHDREGFKLRPYLDSKGIPTIGMGNTYYTNGKKVSLNDKPLTVTQAAELASLITDEFSKFVEGKLRQKVNQDQFNALVSIAYNIGKTAFAGSTFFKQVNENPKDPNIAASIMMWTKNKELIGRRLSEVEQYFSYPVASKEMRDIIDALRKKYT